MRPIERSGAKGYLADIIPALGGRGIAGLLLGGLVVQFDHDAIGVIDEDLPEIAARNLPGVERHALGLQAAASCRQTRG